jgi:hypothetical protein
VEGSEAPLSPAGTARGSMRRVTARAGCEISRIAAPAPAARARARGTVAVCRRQRLSGRSGGAGGADKRRSERGDRRRPCLLCSPGRTLRSRALKRQQHSRAWSAGSRDARRRTGLLTMGGPGASSWRATTAARRAREGVPSAASTCPSGHLLLLRKAEQQARLLSSHPSASQRILRPPRCCLESLASVRSEARTSAMRASLSVRPRRARDARRAGAGRTIAGSGARGAAAACGARASRGVAPLPAGPWQRVASFFPSSTPPSTSCLSDHARSRLTLAASRACCFSASFLRLAQRHAVWLRCLGACD